MISVLVVTEVLSIASEKVTETLSAIETALWLSVGVTEVTANGILAKMISRTGRTSVKDMESIMNVLKRHKYVVEDYVTKSNDSSYIQVTKA